MSECSAGVAMIVDYEFPYRANVRMRQSRLVHTRWMRAVEPVFVRDFADADAPVVLRYTNAVDGDFDQTVRSHGGRLYHSVGGGAEDAACADLATIVRKRFEFPDVLPNTKFRYERRTRALGAPLGEHVPGVHPKLHDVLADDHPDLVRTCDSDRAERLALIEDHVGTLLVVDGQLFEPALDLVWRASARNRTGGHDGWNVEVTVAQVHPRWFVAGDWPSCAPLTSPDLVEEMARNLTLKWGWPVKPMGRLELKRADLLPERSVMSDPIEILRRVAADYLSRPKRGRTRPKRDEERAIRAALAPRDGAAVVEAMTGCEACTSDRPGAFANLKLLARDGSLDDERALAAFADGP